MRQIDDVKTGDRRLIASRLADGINDYIRRGDSDDSAYNTLARETFAYQYRFNAPYRAFCDGRGVMFNDIKTWRDIPAAPAAAFKRFALTCAPEEKCRPPHGVTFHSSGTTGAETSRHLMDSATVSVYRRSISDGFRRFVALDGAVTPIFALMPDAKQSPHSSLSFMLNALGFVRRPESGLTAFVAGNATLRAKFEAEVRQIIFLWERGWQEELVSQFRDVERPVTLFGTAFAFVHFFDHSEERFALPPGSRIVETGGFKGKSREVSREELYALFTERFGVPATHCISEYGMSEMASQYYDSTLYDFVNGIRREPRKIAPPTLRTRIIDPVMNADVAPGQPGLLIHYDLANLNSVMAIQSEDLGVWAEDGDGFHLLGRAPGAVLRGCSLTAEEVRQQ